MEQGPATADHERFTRVVALDPLDDVLYQTDDLFALDRERVTQVRFTALSAAFRRHFDGCADYRRYAEGRGVGPDDIDDPHRLDLIPLVPTSVFKRKELVTRPLDGRARVCVSSGTQGGRSHIVRDRRTLERFVGSVDQGGRLLGVDTDRPGHIFVLGPDTAEAGDLWFSYVLSICDLLLPTSFHVRGGIFRMDELLEALNDRTAGVRPVVLGPPVLVRELAEVVKDRYGTLDLGSDDGLVITAGGWKRAAGSAVPRDELSDLAVQAFALRDRGQVRDCFNMVELNTVLFECESQVKHIPPWLRVTARDPANLAPLPSGVEGTLAFLDALPTSYPGFVLSDDFGIVRYGVACACGRTSDTLAVTRRIQTVEARGCALKMDGTVRR
ncbi:MAG TPA: hypothetical protein VIR33_17090 [Thermopolyspora sp.]